MTFAPIPPKVANCNLVHKNHVQNYEIMCLISLD